MIKNLDQIINEILKNEVHFHFSKSGWHGWQNVNKRMTKAELYFNVWDSRHLSDEQKQKIIDNAWHRIHHHEKILIMTDQEERTQEANKEKVTHHFKEFLHSYLDT